MKYCVRRDLSIFEFHDSEFSLAGFDGKDMVVLVKNLNVHKYTEQNPFDYDMEIECAHMTFKGFNVFTYEPGRVWKTGEDGKAYPVGPRVVFYGKDAEDKMLEELHNQIFVCDFSTKDNGTYFIDGIGIEPFFTIEFCFDDVIVEWEEYRKKAWYELYKQYCYKLTLNTLKGDEQVDVRVGCYDEEVYCDGVLEKEPTVNVGMKYAGEEFWGHGSDELWIDAFADLQRQLPEGVSIKCCLTCRHGNLCPVGNVNNELFCLKDVVTQQKSDLYYYTEDESERKKRTRQYCHLCEDFRPQSEEYYTYNGFLDYLLQK